MALVLDHPSNIISHAQAASLTADAEALCPRGDATLRGAYMSQGGGTITGVGLITFQGTVYLDGKGGVKNPFTASFNGTIVRVVAPGTYTIESDCTGTMVLGGADHFDMRISPDGSRIDYIKTDAGAIVSGRATRVQD
jgi:hypothetical protein